SNGSPNGARRGSAAWIASANTSPSSTKEESDDQGTQRDACNLRDRAGVRRSARARVQCVRGLESESTVVRGSGGVDLIGPGERLPGRRVRARVGGTAGRADVPLRGALP